MATTILVVEDDLEINELVGEYLALESIRYLKATTGAQGLHMAAAEHPDAIILDLMLPDVDGFEVARQLTSHRATHEIPIIILSCMCQECDREKGFTSGALHFINKPFLPDHLLAVVRAALTWKAEFKKHVPTGKITLSGAPADAKKNFACSRAINQMVTDLFTQTDLPDESIAEMRQAMEMLREWGTQWNAEHADQPTQATVEYRVRPRGVNGTINGSPLIEWTLREDAPGMIADAFFKPAPGGGFGIGGLIGWGGGNSQARTLAMPPVKWLQLLAKTGSATFEKDPVTKSVRFGRVIPGRINVTPAVELNAAQ